MQNSSTALVGYFIFQRFPSHIDLFSLRFDSGLVDHFTIFHFNDDRALNGVVILVQRSGAGNRREILGGYECCLDLAGSAAPARLIASTIT